MHAHTNTHTHTHTHKVCVCEFDILTQRCYMLFLWLNIYRQFKDSKCKTVHEEFLDCLTIENEGSTILRNVGNRWSSDAASHLQSYRAEFRFRYEHKFIIIWCKCGLKTSISYFVLKLWCDELFAVNVIVFRAKLHRRDGRTHAASLHAVFKLTSKDHNIIIDFPLYPNRLFVFTVLLPVAIQ